MNEIDNEIDELREQYKLLSDTKVPQQTRSNIKMMIDRYHSISIHKKKVSWPEVFRTAGAMIAAVAVVCFVILRVTLSSTVSTTGARLNSLAVQSHLHVLMPDIVLLGTSAAILVITWIFRKVQLELVYRYPTMRWLSGQSIGVRLYDSVRLQTYTSILFSWVMFAIFVAPSSTSPWVGVVAFLLFCTMCGSVRYLLFSIVVLLTTTIPSWWLATLPTGDVVSWYPMIILNIAFFILTPGMVLIPARNALIRKFEKRERQMKS